MPFIFICNWIQMFFLKFLHLDLFYFKLKSSNPEVLFRAFLEVTCLFLNFKVFQFILFWRQLVMRLFFFQFFFFNLCSEFFFFELLLVLSFFVKESLFVLLIFVGNLVQMFCLKFFQFQLFNFKLKCLHPKVFLVNLTMFCVQILNLLLCILMLTF